MPTTCDSGPAVADASNAGTCACRPPRRSGASARPATKYLLLPLLADAQWWVRYRAAQALTRLPAIGEKDVMQRIRDEQTDRFACDVLDQVMAERNIGVRQMIDDARFSPAVIAALDSCSGCSSPTSSAST